MIRLSLRSNQFMVTLCRKSKSKKCMVSGSFAWVCICILEGGHFSFLDANADPRMIGLALTQLCYYQLLAKLESGLKVSHVGGR